MDNNRRFSAWLIPGIYLCSRALIFAYITSNGIDSFGDLNEYYGLGTLEGWPFFGYWVEYPPAFAFLNELVYRISQDKFQYLLLTSLVLALAGAACLFIFQRIGERLYGPREGLIRSILFLALLLPFPYTWWYYDLIPLACLLAGLDWLTCGRSLSSGLALGMGMLAKWFPGFALAAVLRYRPAGTALKILITSLALVGMVLGALYLASPEMTAASLSSQAGRTSWQTVWAYLDGNRVTGWFVYWDWRYDPAQAYVPRGNPARFPGYLTLLVFAAAGLFFFWKVKNLGERSLIAFVGLTFAIFLMWSPGWSPQWVLYLLPLVFLTLPTGQALILSLVLMVIALFEWPFALGQGWFRAVFAMAGLRMLTFALLVFLWYRKTQLRAV